MASSSLELAAVVREIAKDVLRRVPERSAGWMLGTLGTRWWRPIRNYTPMCGERSRRVKTDGRDVAALAEACRLGLSRQVHRWSHTPHSLCARRRSLKY